MHFLMPDLMFILPTLIKDFGNNSICKVKTDKADAVKIDRYSINYWDYIKLYSTEDALRLRLKNYSRHYAYFVKLKTAVKNKLTTLIELSFLDIEDLFSSPERDIDGQKKAIDFIIRYWHRDCVTSMSLNAFCTSYKSRCKIHGYNYRSRSAEKIHAFARQCYQPS